MAWAFEMAGQVNARLFMSLETVTEPCINDCNTKSLANTAVAHLTASQLLGKELVFTPATESFYGKTRLSGESEPVETELKYENDL